MDRNISLKEITIEQMEKAGAVIVGMDEGAVHMFDDFCEHMRIRYEAKIEFCYNGLNSGKHSSKYHNDGHAFDFIVIGGTWKIFDIIATAVYTDFTGIGVYWNGEALSFHVDDRSDYAQWLGKKDENGEWKYSALINDPRN